MIKVKKAVSAAIFIGAGLHIQGWVRLNGNFLERQNNLLPCFAASTLQPFARHESRGGKFP